jgi:hypothetical protein
MLEGCILVYSFYTNPFSFISFFLFTADFAVFLLDMSISPYGMILRHSQSHYLSLYEDPEDWTPTVRVTRGIPVYLWAGGLIFHDDQPLLPRDLTAASPFTHLLGKKMIDGEASHWADIDFSLPHRYHDHQLDWNLYILTVYP